MSLEVDSGLGSAFLTVETYSTVGRGVVEVLYWWWCWSEVSKIADFGTSLEGVGVGVQKRVKNESNKVFSF